MTFFIGLSGLAGVGKSTLAHALKEKLNEGGFSVTVASLSEPIYRFFATAEGHSDYKEYKSVVKEKGFTLPRYKGLSFRAGATLVADAMKEAAGDTYFIDTLVERYGNLKWDFVIIDDIRYHYEAEECDYVVRLETQTRQTIDIGFDHSSEHPNSINPDKWVYLESILDTVWVSDQIAQKVSKLCQVE